MNLEIATKVYFNKGQYDEILSSETDEVDVRKVISELKEAQGKNMLALIKRAAELAPEFYELTKGDPKRSYLYQALTATQDPDSVSISDEGILFKRWAREEDDTFSLPLEYLFNPESWTKDYLAKRKEIEEETEKEEAVKKELKQAQRRAQLIAQVEKDPELVEEIIRKFNSNTNMKGAN